MPEQGRWGTAPAVEVDGRPLPPDVAALLEEVVVDDSLHLPDVLELRLRDDGRDLLARAGLRLGAEVRVSARRAGGGAPAPLLSAQVATLEADAGPRGRHLLVRCYDASWQLAQTRRTTSYADVTDSEAVRLVARAAQVPLGAVDPTPVVHEHLAQVDLTDWEFLQQRARACGRECLVQRGALHFRVPSPGESAPAAAAPGAEPGRLQLVVGENLLAFRPRLSTQGQVRDVEVRGWDPATKRAVVARAATRSPGTPEHDTGALAAVSGGTVHVAVDRGAATQAEAEAGAAALAEQLGSTAVEATGTALGDPELTAGAAVHVTGAGAPFDGRYVLTATRHVYDARGYRTWFEVSGRHDRSLAGLLAGRSTGDRPPSAGVAVAEVTDVRDPQERGRVRVRLPWLSDTYETWWSRVVQAGAGDARGGVWLPEVGDEVLVAFEQGDVRRPVVVGGLHNGVDALPLGSGLVDATSGSVQRRGFVSRGGHRLVLDDGRDSPGVVVESGDGSVRIALLQQETVVEVTSDGEVRISGARGVSLSSDADISVHAKGRLELRGDAGVSVQGGPEVAVSAAAVRLG